MSNRSGKPDSASLDRVVAKAQRDRLLRDQGYREQALKICGSAGVAPVNSRGQTCAS
jgi:hypothetical protein